MGSVCYRYLCILLYMKLIQCSGVAIDLGSPRLEGVGSVCHEVYVHSAICET